MAFFLLHPPAFSSACLTFGQVRDKHCFLPGINEDEPEAICYVGSPRV
jgi:hypothetical protein